MNKRFTIYYFFAAYCGYIAYSLVKEIQEGAPTSFFVNVVTVGFFSVAAIFIAVYTTILVRREKKQKKTEDSDDSQNQL